MSTIVKGSISAIPAALLNKKARGASASYEFDKLEVGDHYVYPADKDAVARLRSAYTSYSTKHKVRLVGTTVVNKEEGKEETKEFQVWRLPAIEAKIDTPAVSEAPVADAVSTTTMITELPTEIEPPVFENKTTGFRKK